MGRARFARQFPAEVARATLAIYQNLGQLLEAKTNWAEHLAQDIEALQGGIGSLQGQVEQGAKELNALEATRQAQHAFIRQLVATIADLTGAYRQLEETNRANETRLAQLEKQLELPVDTLELLPDNGITTRQ